MQHYLIILLFMTMQAYSHAQQNVIKDFTIKENLTQNGRLAIVATDTTGLASEAINGTFVFTLNGLQQELSFRNGVAVADSKIASSTFVFFKHKNQEDTIGKLFYVFKSDKGLNPIKISGLALLLIPSIILLIAYTFKRFILAAVILALAYAFFNYSQGLSLANLMESIIMGIKSFI